MKLETNPLCSHFLAPGLVETFYELYSVFTGQLDI
jgi:hypothetical protein